MKTFKKMKAKIGNYWGFDGDQISPKE